MDEAYEFQKKVLRGEIELADYGGPGSGNHGHKGAPGISGMIDYKYNPSQPRDKAGRWTSGGGELSSGGSSPKGGGGTSGKGGAGERQGRDGGTASFDGKYLHVDGRVTSLPKQSEGEFAEFSNRKGSTLKISETSKGEVYGDFNNYDKTWDTPKKFVGWLNGDGKDFEYVGFDKY
jgi:hypothetical protein